MTKLPKRSFTLFALAALVADSAFTANASAKDSKKAAEIAALEE